MKDNAIKKINTLGNVGLVLARIAQILFSFVGVIIIISTIALAFLPKDFVTIQMHGTGTINVNMPQLTSVSEQDIMASNASFEINNNEFDILGMEKTATGIALNAAGDFVDFSTRKLIPVLLLALANIIIYIVLAFIIGSLCKAFMTCQTPFEEAVIKKMTTLTYALIPLAIISTVNESIPAFLFNPNSGINLSLNMNTILVIIILFGLTFVFKYGAVLQQESDETL